MPVRFVCPLLLIRSRIVISFSIIFSQTAPYYVTSPLFYATVCALIPGTVYTLYTLHVVRTVHIVNVQCFDYISRIRAFCVCVRACLRIRMDVCQLHTGLAGALAAIFAYAFVWACVCVYVCFCCFVREAIQPNISRYEFKRFTAFWIGYRGKISGYLTNLRFVKSNYYGKRALFRLDHNLTQPIA